MMITDEIGIEEVNSKLEEKLKVIKSLDRSEWNPFKEDTRTERQKRIDYDNITAAVDSINTTLFDARYSEAVNAVKIKTKVKFNRVTDHLPSPGIISKGRWNVKDFFKTALNKKKCPKKAEYTFYKELTENDKFKYLRETPYHYRFHIHKQIMEIDNTGSYVNLTMELNEPYVLNGRGIHFKALFFIDEIESIKLVNINENKLTPQLKEKWDDKTGAEYYLE